MRRVKGKEYITDVLYVPPPSPLVTCAAKRAARLRAEKSTAARVHVLLPVEWSRMQKAVPEITTCPRALDAQS